MAINGHGKMAGQNGNGVAINKVSEPDLLWTMDLRNVALTASHLPRSDILDGGRPSKACAVRSIDICAKKGKLLVGILGCEVFEIDLQGPEEEKLSLLSPPSENLVRGITHGHWRGGERSGGLWGLATHPTAPEYATVGDDSTLRLWDSITRVAKYVIKLPGPARTCRVR